MGYSKKNITKKRILLIHVKDKTEIVGKLSKPYVFPNRGFTKLPFFD